MLEELDKAWPLITTAPRIALGAALVIATCVFLIVRWGYARVIEALKAEIGVLNARLLLAQDNQTALEKVVATLQQTAATAHVPSNVVEAIRDVQTANTTLGSTLSESAKLVETVRKRFPLLHPST